MFQCGVCGKFFGPGISPKKKVLETREVVHHDIWKDADGITRRKDTPGTQIVREVNSCQKCYEI